MQQLACLDCVRRHLADDGKSGGRLVFDVFNPSLAFLTDDSRLERRAMGEPYTITGGRTVQRYDHVVGRDLNRQVQQIELVYEITEPDGSTHTLSDRFPMRHFFRWELEHLLARAGFAIEHVYADFDRSPFGSKYPGEIIVVARAAR